MSKRFTRGVVTIGKVVHYVAEDYECAAMIVTTSDFFEDDLDCELQYGHTGRDTLGVTLQVHHPFSYTVGDQTTGEPVAIAMTTVEVCQHSGVSHDVKTWHWPDECAVVVS